MRFHNKTILVLSQHEWGKMFVSKHHYALELSRMGNTVYYINGPDQENVLKPGEIKISPTGYDNLFSITHRLYYPYFIKFRAKWLHDFLIRFHHDRIVKKIGGKVDIVWSFDLSDTMPLKAFRNVGLKIYMIADMPTALTVTGAETADVILSTNFSDKFMNEQFAMWQVPKKFTNHGVAEKFIAKDINVALNTPLQVGMSGNFLRSDIDWDTLIIIIQQHPEVRFNFWGSYDVSDANLTASTEANVKAIDLLKGKNNVMFHGPVEHEKLSEELNKMDAFLICYDIDKDYSRGTNYHKVLEYLATGKVVIANNISAYDGRHDLIQMPMERNNSNLAKLFSEVIGNIHLHNGYERQKARIEYAKDHTYRKNIEKIELLTEEIGIGG